MSERISDWNQPETWKRITCIMMICAGQHNKDIMIATQCFLNTVKTIRPELDLQWRLRNSSKKKDPQQTI